jgi:hypothetical protein
MLARSEVRYDCQVALPKTAVAANKNAVCIQSISGNFCHFNPPPIWASVAGLFSLSFNKLFAQYGR